MRVVGARVLAAWEDLLDAVAGAGADLERPSRLPGWSGTDVVVHLGLWEDNAVLDAVVADARAGRRRPPAGTDGNERVVAAHRGEGPDAAVAALARSRDRVHRFFAAGEAAEVAAADVGSSLGTLPALCLVGAGAYEVAVHGLDLVPCGVRPPAPSTLQAGLGALIDVTGALCVRQGLRERVGAVAPDGGWVTDARSPDGWTTTAVTADAPVPAGARGAADVLLDVSAGRRGLGPTLASGAMTVAGLPTFLRLAPLVEQVPGLPGGAALSSGARALSGLGRLAGGLGRLLR